MDITTKNTQYSKFASHETPCFQTTLNVNGFDVAIVENDGQGGCHKYILLGNGSELTRNRVLFNAAEKYARSRDPKGFEQLDYLVYELTGLA